MTQLIVFCRWVLFTTWCVVGILMYLHKDGLNLLTYKIIAWTTWVTLMLALLRIALGGL